MALRLLKNTTRPKSLLSLTDIAGLIAIGAAAFAATNIDDIFVLLVLFSTSSVAYLTFPVRHVVLGQYLGISLLIAIGALGSLIPLLVPPYVIGLLGIVPMAIGARRLVQFIRKDGNTSIIPTSKKSNSINRPYLPFLVVAAITFSNVGDNIGIYTPLFAQYNSFSQVTTHGNDCCMVCRSILPCKSSIDRITNKSDWSCSTAICSHWTWNLYSSTNISCSVIVSSAITYSTGLDSRSLDIK